MARLSGKIDLITGGTTGIGETSASMFRNEGATVVVTGASEANVGKAAAAGFDAVRCDQTNMNDIDALMHSIKARHGRLDCLSTLAVDRVDRSQPSHRNCSTGSWHSTLRGLCSPCKKPCHSCQIADRLC